MPMTPRRTGEAIAWHLGVIALIVMTSGCGAHRVQISGAAPLRARPAYAVEIGPQTIRSTTIAGQGAVPDVVVPDVAALLRATLGPAMPGAQTVVRLTVSSIDFEATTPGDELLASAHGAAIFRTHGPGALPGAPTVRVPRFVRIKFIAELWRANESLGRVSGAVSGDVRVLASEESARAAIGSAIDRLLGVVERVLVRQHIARTPT